MSSGLAKLVVAGLYANLMEMVVMEYAACIVYHNQRKMLRMHACFQSFVVYYLFCMYLCICLISIFVLACSKLKRGWSQLLWQDCLSSGICRQWQDRSPLHTNMYIIYVYSKIARLEEKTEAGFIYREVLNHSCGTKCSWNLMIKYDTTMSRSTEAARKASW